MKLRISDIEASGATDRHKDNDGKLDSFANFSLKADSESRRRADGSIGASGIQIGIRVKPRTYLPTQAGQVTRRNKGLALSTITMQTFQLVWWPTDLSRTFANPATFDHAIIHFSPLGCTHSIAECRSIGVRSELRALPSFDPKEASLVWARERRPYIRLRRDEIFLAPRRNISLFHLAKTLARRVEFCA